MNYNANKTRIWDRQTPADGDLFDAEFNRIYANIADNRLKVISKFIAGTNYSSGQIIFHDIYGFCHVLDTVTNAQEDDFSNDIHKFKPVGSVGAQIYGETELFGYLFMDARTLGATGSGATLAHDKYIQLRDHLLSRVRVGLGALTVSSVVNNGGGKVRLTFSGTPVLKSVQIEDPIFPSQAAKIAGLGVELPADSARVNFGSGFGNYKIIGVNIRDFYVDIDLAFSSQIVSGTVGIYPYRIPGNENLARLPESRKMFFGSGLDGYLRDTFQGHRFYTFSNNLRGVVSIPPHGFKAFAYQSKDGGPYGYRLRTTSDEASINATSEAISNYHHSRPRTGYTTQPLTVGKLGLIKY